MDTVTRFMTRSTRVALLLAVLLGAASMGAPLRMGASPAFAAAYQPVTTESSCLNSEEKHFLTLINKYRMVNGLPALKYSRTLSVAAYHHSKDMGTRGYFAHDTMTPLFPGQSGSGSPARMRDAGYTYNTVTFENIAAGFSYSTAEAVFAGWRASTGHNATMLRPDLKVIGIGMAQVSGSTYGTYWTTDFGGVVELGLGIAC